MLRYYNDVVMGEPDGNFPANKKSFIRLQELEKLMKLGTINKIEMFGESSKVYVYLILSFVTSVRLLSSILISLPTTPF